MIKLNRAKEICSQFKDKKILVFGDVILDRYIFGRVDRISPEAPVPVVKVESEEHRCGGAGNVAVNIDKLGASGLLMGIAGDDLYAGELDRLKTDGNLIIKSPSHRTLVKTRIISQRQQMVRVDREEEIEVSQQIRDSIYSTLKKFKPDLESARTPGSESARTPGLESARTPGLDGIIVSDYAKGTLDQGTMDTLKALAGSLSIPLIVDPKPPNYHLYKNIDGITPNLKEAEAIVNKRLPGDADAAAAVKQIRNKFNSNFSIITRGSQGITAGERGKRTFHMPALNHEVYDVTGAGDTVVSILMLSLVSGASLKEAVILSNIAASLVVERIGASQVTIDEIYHRVKRL